MAANGNPIPAVILAGGLGTRLHGVMADRPKVLAPVSGRPFITYLLDQLVAAGWREVVLCTGFLSEQVEAELGSQYKTLKLAYSVEREPLGTAGAIRLALEQFDSPLCLAMNGDSFVQADFRAFLDWHREHDFASSLLLNHVDDAARYGTVEVTPEDRVIGFREKQGESVPGWINAGVYLLPRTWLEAIPDGRAVSIERECFPAWTKKNLGGYRTRAAFIDIGTPESLIQAADILKDPIFAKQESSVLMTNSPVRLPAEAEQHVKAHFTNSMAVKQQVIDDCLPDIIAAATCIATALAEKHKLLLCGNGGSAADSQHLAAEFVSVLTQDFLRPGLPAIALTTDSSILTASANDFGFDGVFRRQIQALGQPGDVVIGISTSGNSRNVLFGLEYAREHGIHTIALTGAGGGQMAQVAEIAIRVPSTVTQYIQESHIAIAHVLCHLAERALFPEG